MEENAYWTAVTDLRLRVADLLGSLEPDEWQAASLCDGWRVRDVAGHVACVPTITTWELLAAAPRGRFDMNRINADVGRRYGALPTAELVARIRAHAGTRRTAKVLDTRNGLFDIIVHSQDIALPLGRTFDVDPDLTAQGLRRVWEMGMPFHARKKLAGLRLRATDADLTLGSGAEVYGPALALLLYATGRSDVALPDLAGDGISRP